MQTRRRSPGIQILLSIVFFMVTGYSGAHAQATSGKTNTPGADQVNQSQVQAEEIPTDEATVAHGRELFGQHCAVCHQVGKQVIGPALASVYQRRPLPWLLMFIKNSQTVITKQDDEYAKQLFEQYNNQVMPPFEFLSNEDIVSILAYIKAESSSTTPNAGVNGSSSAVNQKLSDEAGKEAYSQKGDDEQNAAEPSSGLSATWIFGILSGMLILIAVIFIVAKNSTKSARKAK